MGMLEFLGGLPGAIPYAIGSGLDSVDISTRCWQGLVDARRSGRLGAGDYRPV